jgi:tetratricopeptide (TPR) repeat protein
MHRIALSYGELARVAGADHDAFAQKPEGQAEAHKADVIRIVAHQSAAKYHALISREYPSWCPPRRDGTQRDLPVCRAESAYFQGLALEGAGQRREAFRAYLEAINAAPDTIYVPYAFFATGELFVREAETRPDRWPLAQQSFEEAARFPAPGNPLQGPALLRLGEVHRKLGDLEGARDAFRKLRDLATAGGPGSPAEVAMRLAPSDS